MADTPLYLQLTAEQYEEAIAAFLGRCQQLGIHEWSPLPMTSTVTTVLSHSPCIRLTPKGDHFLSEDNAEEDISITEIDDPSAHVSDTLDGEWSSWQYYISWSMVWQVPILHFTASAHDGSPLSVDAIYGAIPSGMRSDVQSKDILHAAFTPQYIPSTSILGWGLHPCETISLLTSLSPTHRGLPLPLYIPIWLSVYGGYIGLRIDPRLATDPPPS